jgi:hypothetical protein
LPRGSRPAARSCDAAFVVVSAVDSRAFGRHAAELRQLATGARLCLGGADAASTQLDVGVLSLTGGPVEAADQLTGLAPVS